MKRMRFPMWLTLWLAGCALSPLAVDAATVQVVADPRTLWSIERITSALNEVGQGPASGTPGAVEISLSQLEMDLPEGARRAEGYRIVALPDRVRIIGFDHAGVLYGSLDLVRRVREQGRLPDQLDVADAPVMTVRGVTIRLMKAGNADTPITPQDFPFLYDKGIWARYLDFLAENGYNALVFGHNHPFEYFVAMEKYPEAQADIAPAVIQQNHDLLLWLGAEAEKRNITLMFEFHVAHAPVGFSKAHGSPGGGIPDSPDALKDYCGHCLERFVGEFPGVGLYIHPGQSPSPQVAFEWIDGVVLAAVQRSGKTPAIVARSEGMDVEHMKALAVKYPKLSTEHAYNAAMLAAPEANPAIKEWAAIAGSHILAVQGAANLDPFRWSPPTYVQKCLQHAIALGANGLDLSARTAWRWPYGCDKVEPAEFQWNRDWMWFEAWGRYAWNPNRDPNAERPYWTYRLTQTYGALDAATALLDAFEQGADVLPAIQRLLWIGGDAQTVVAAGAYLDQILQARGAPFLPAPGMVRIPAYLDAVKAGKSIEGISPIDYLATKVAEADKALASARDGVQKAVRNQPDAQRIATDAEAVAHVARFYLHKVAAAIAKALFDAGIDPVGNSKACLENLRASVAEFQALTALTANTYDSISDIPASTPTSTLPTPYHWADVLPLYQQELSAIEKDISERAPDPASGNLFNAARSWEKDSPLANQMRDLVVALAKAAQDALPLIDSVDALNARKAELRTKLQAVLGLSPFPEKTPLNAQSLGVLDYPDFTLEKVTFEGWAGLPIPAHLYRPKNAPGPVPCVIQVLSGTDKTDADVRMACVDLTRQGIAALVFDTIVDGERRSADGARPQHLFPLLAGLTQQGIMVWETVRAIDYAASRTDVVNPAAIAIASGNEAGAVTALIVAVLDDRPAAVALATPPSAFVEFLHKAEAGLDNRTPGIAALTSVAELMSCIAPKPFCHIAAVEGGLAPIASAREVSQRVAAAYALTAQGNHVFVETPGAAQRTREVLAGFFAKSLLAQGDGSPVPEAPAQLEPSDAPNLRCFAEGNQPVAAPLLALVHQILTAGPEFAAPPAGAAGPELSTWQGQVAARIRHVTATPAPEGIGAPVEVASAPVDGVTLRRVTVVPEAGITVPILLAAKADLPAPPTVSVLLIGERSKTDVIASPLARQLIERGVLVCAADLRGVGELRSDVQASVLSADLWMLGRTLAGERIADITAIARFLKTQPGMARVCVTGLAGMGNEAILAAACIPEIDAVIAEGPLASYADLLSPAATSWPASVYVPSILKHVDLPAIVSSIAPRKTLLIAPVGGDRQPVPADRAAVIAANPAYATLQAAPALVVAPPAPVTADQIMAVAAP